MSRVGIMQDVPAQICWEYCNGNLSRAKKQQVYGIVFIAIPNRRKVKQFIREIAYRIGYAKSDFANIMSEVTYKKKKQWCRNLIEKELAKRSKNEKTDNENKA